MNWLLDWCLKLRKPMRFDNGRPNYGSIAVAYILGYMRRASMPMTFGYMARNEEVRNG